MKKFLENKYFKLGLTIFLVVAACILFFFLIYKLELVVDIFKNIIKLLTPFIIGFVFAYLLNPIVKFFESKVYHKLHKNSSKKATKLAHILSITTVCFLVIGVVILLFSFIIPELLTSISALITNFPTYLEQIKNSLLNSLKNHEDLEKMVINNYQAINDYFTNTVNTTLLPKLEEWLVIFSTGVFGAIKGLYNVILGFIISIYFLSGRDTFKAQVKKFLYSILSIKTTNNIIENARHTDAIFGNFIIGKLIDASIIGFITFIFLTLFGYPYALLIGVIIGITNIIPYFGPYIGTLPSALLISLQSPSKCLIFIIFIIALQQIDSYLIDPRLSGTKTGLKSFWVLFAILIFGGLFGLLGMLVGVPIFALIYGYISRKCNLSLLNKELPIETYKYEKLQRINSESKKIINNNE